MKIFGFEINRKEKKEDANYNIARIMREIGVPRDAVIGEYKTEENPDELNIDTYIRMQQNDGTVQAIIRMLSLPIQSAEPFIIGAENDNGEADFIRTVLFGSEFEGGMSTPMALVISDMTRAIAEGFRAYNKVPQVITQGDYKGKIGWRKIAPRDAQTIKIKVDKHGGFDGLHQIATLGDQTIDKNIPKDYALLYTFQKEKHGLYGESILKSAFYHYDKKHKLYYIACKKAEVETMGIRTVELPQAPNPSDRTAIEKAVDNIGINTRISVPHNYKFDVKFPSNGGSDFIMKNIEHHDLEMAKSALCGMLELNSGGSYALSKDKSNWLVLAINGIMKGMEATINSYVIAPLINYNYGTYNYPKFKFPAITTEAEDLLTEVSKSIFSKAEMLPTEVFNDVVNRAVEKMGIKKEPQDATKELKKIEKESDEKEKIDNLVEKAKTEVKLEEPECPFWREKNKYEQSVSFEDIEERMDLQSVDLEEKLLPIFKKQRAQLKVAIKKAIRNNDIKSIKKLKLIKQDKMQEILLEEMNDTFEFSKRKAADDDKNQSPKTSKATEKILKAKAKEYADMHEDSVKESTIKYLEEALKDKNLKLEEQKEEDWNDTLEEIIEKVNG